MKNIIFIAAIAISIVFESCNSNKTETHGEETEHHDEHENSNTSMLTAEQMKSIKIELGSIEKKLSALQKLVLKVATLVTLNTCKPYKPLPMCS